MCETEACHSKVHGDERKMEAGDGEKGVCPWPVSQTGTKFTPAVSQRKVPAAGTYPLQLSRKWQPGWDG